jgi:predicted GIY-YIG superfamily endonuclease
LERSEKRWLPRRSLGEGGRFASNPLSAPRLRLGRPAFLLHGPLSTRSAMKGLYYVYILVSEADGRLHYSGLTCDLNTRLAEHNRGKCPHTSKHRPWKIETAIAFRSEAKARRFERYLKTGSGREFARRHL